MISNDFDFFDFLSPKYNLVSFLSTALKHDDVRNQNKAGTHCTVGLIRGLLSNNSVIIRKSFSVPNAL